MILFSKRIILNPMIILGLHDLNFNDHDCCVKAIAISKNSQHQRTVGSDNKYQEQERKRDRQRKIRNTKFKDYKDW